MIIDDPHGTAAKLEALRQELEEARAQLAAADAMRAAIDHIVGGETEGVDGEGVRKAAEAYDRVRAKKTDETKGVEE